MCLDIQGPRARWLAVRADPFSGKMVVCATKRGRSARQMQSQILCIQRAQHLTAGRDGQWTLPARLSLDAWFLQETKKIQEQRHKEGAAKCVMSTDVTERKARWSEGPSKTQTFFYLIFKFFQFILKLCPPQIRSGKPRPKEAQTPDGV